MNEKVSLVFENNEYIVYINNGEKKVYKSFDEAVESFKGVIEVLSVEDENSWDNLVKKIEEYREIGLSINNDYKTMELFEAKFFGKTNKLFFIGEDMTELIGGFNAFEAIAFLLKEGKIESVYELLSLLKDLNDKKVNYKLTDMALLVLSPAFNYGSAEYNFLTRKINKGASIEKMSFEDFMKYIRSIIFK